MIHNNDDHSSNGGHGDMPFLVPLLDLTMILLFFFVIMSNAAQNVFDIKLPSADKSYDTTYTPPADESEVVKIFITQTNFMIDKTSFDDIEKFKESISAIVQSKVQQGKDPKDIKMTVSSSKEVEVQRFLKIMTFLKSTGLEKVDIIMDSNKE